MPTFFSLPYHKISVKNNLRTRHRDHIIVTVAIAMTLVATVALGSSTYAWFSINSKVTATGMSFKTTVSDNLFIVEDELTSTAKKDDADFKTAIVQSISDKVLEPVSTVNGKEFFYASVTNVLGNGDTKADEWIQYDPSDMTKFEKNYSATGAVGYIDYVYQLKAINGGDNAAYVKLTELGLTYNGDNDKQKAYRAAVFTQDITNGTVTGGPDTLMGIYRVEGANYFGTKNNGTYTNEDQAVSKTKGDDALTVVSNIDKAASMTVDAHTTKYYKVVVRLWLEGEDTTCNNTTFADLTKGKWGLNCAWTLENTAFGESDKKYLIEVQGTQSLAGATLDNNTTVVINGEVYTLISNKTLDEKKLYVLGTSAPTADNSARIFQILGNDGNDGELYPIEVTHRINYIPAP